MLGIGCWPATISSSANSCSGFRSFTDFTKNRHVCSFWLLLFLLGYLPLVTFCCAVVYCLYFTPWEGILSPSFAMVPAFFQPYFSFSFPSWLKKKKQCFTFIKYAGFQASSLTCLKLNKQNSPSTLSANRNH